MAVDERWRPILIASLMLLIYGTNSCTAEDAETGGHGGDVEEKVDSYSIVSWQWHHVQYPFTIALWLLLCSYAKVFFHFLGFNYGDKRVIVSQHVPDSSLLIILGLIVGVIAVLIDSTSAAKLELRKEEFFLFLLPPIVFDAGYFMPNRAFFDNLGTILVYAVLGTLFNTLAIGGSLIGLAAIPGLFTDTMHEAHWLHILLFASLISAVDPVAVLVVFEEVHVNETLYINVFGESLLNDAVAVVLYTMFRTFGLMETVVVWDGVKGILSFFVIGLGGVLIGVVWAIIIALTTKFMSTVDEKDACRILNPLFILLIPYCAYLTAELFHMSGILAIVFCGIVMKQYIKPNVRDKTVVTVKMLIKMVSSSAETLIFVFLGTSTIVALFKGHGEDIGQFVRKLTNSSAAAEMDEVTAAERALIEIDPTVEHNPAGMRIDWGFILFTIVFCLIYRCVSVLVLTFMVNKHRTNPFSFVDQVIMAYGGLRGAIAYGLAVSIPNHFKEKPYFEAATIGVVLFTVFVQGITIKPLVNLLKVRRAEAKVRLVSAQVFERIFDHWMAGIEDICGYYGHHWWRQQFEHLNDLYIKPCLTAGHTRGSSRADMKIVRTAMRVATKEAVLEAKGLNRVSSTATGVGMGSRKPSAARLASVEQYEYSKMSKRVGLANAAFQRDQEDLRRQMSTKHSHAQHMRQMSNEYLDSDYGNASPSAGSPSGHGMVRIPTRVDMDQYFQPRRPTFDVGAMRRQQLAERSTADINEEFRRIEAARRFRRESIGMPAQLVRRVAKLNGAGPTVPEELVDESEIEQTTSKQLKKVSEEGHGAADEVDPASDSVPTIAVTAPTTLLDSYEDANNLYCDMPSPPPADDNDKPAPAPVENDDKPAPRFLIGDSTLRSSDDSAAAVGSGTPTDEKQQRGSDSGEAAIQKDTVTEEKEK